MKFIHIANNPVPSNTLTYNGEWVPHNYIHSIDANSGFKTCSFDLYGTQQELEEMLFQGLGRRITRYSTDGIFQVWDGQIVEMSLSLPGLVTNTSLLDMYNNVYVTYTQLNTAVNPPTETSGVITTVAHDVPSHEKYGIKTLFYQPQVEKMVLGMADQLRDVLLEQYREPRRRGEVVTGGGVARLHVVARGFYDTLSWQLYNQAAVSGTQNASDQIAAILLASAQFVLSSKITANTTQVNRYTNDFLPASSVIDQITSVGDSSNNRWVSYIIGDRRFYYEPAQSTVTYFRRVSDARLQIYDLMGRELPFWEVRPNRWLRTTDIQGFAAIPTNIVDDRSAMYIERVDWNEDQNSITLTGSTKDKIQTYVARLSNAGEVLL
jgi:hypothetical protein